MISNLNLTQIKRVNRKSKQLNKLFSQVLDHYSVIQIRGRLIVVSFKCSGGLNGRPEKLPDVCYSWWVLASLAILGRLHWICPKSLSKFILASQVKIF